MSSTPVLYHAESSFYSQRARLAFAEKGIRYKGRWVSLLEGENHTLKFIQNVNPKGRVPAMEHRGVFYTDSRDIIEYVDTLPSDKPRLCPEGNSEEAIQVRYFRDLLESLDIPVISFGSIYHRETLTTNCLAPSFVSKKMIEGSIAAETEKMAKLKRDHPADVGPTTDYVKFKDMATNEATVLGVLNDADKIFEEVEEQLRKQKAKYGDEEFWLVAKTFTIADIFLACVLHRVTYVGQSERLFLSKRPLISDYYQRVLKRKTFQQQCAYANSTFWSVVVPMTRSAFHKFLPVAFVLSVAAAGVVAYHKKDLIIEFAEKKWAEIASQKSDL